MTVDARCALSARSEREEVPLLRSLVEVLVQNGKTVE